MAATGTVVNGVVVPDPGAALPEGARVRIEVEERLEDPHPLAPFDRAQELALLRVRVEEARSGAAGLSLDEAFGQIARDLKLPPVPPG